MSLLYFIPGASSVTRDQVAELGLLYAIDSFKGLGAVGPSGVRGQVVCSSGEIQGYYPDKQTWIAAPKGDEEVPPFWVGWNNENRPTPEALARDEVLPGELITFRDGSKWNVPKLVSWEEDPNGERPAVYSTPLPQMIDVDKYGNPVNGSVVKEYRDLFDLGMRVLAKRIVGDDDLTVAQVLHFAADVIGMNYRVSLLELSSSVLDHISTDDASRVIDVAIDWQGYEGALGNWAGRQGRPITDTDSGSSQSTQAEPVDTDQPSDS